VILKWSFSFVTHGRTARLIDEPLPSVPADADGYLEPPAAGRVIRGS
jgi:hypothetical protein